jgi:hypothetical protein
MAQAKLFLFKIDNAMHCTGKTVLFKRIHCRHYKSQSYFYLLVELKGFSFCFVLIVLVATDVSQIKAF